MNRIVQPIAYALAAIYLLVDAIFIGLAKPIADWVAGHLVLRKLPATQSAMGLGRRPSRIEEIAGLDQITAALSIPCAFFRSPGSPRTGQTGFGLFGCHWAGSKRSGDIRCR